MNRGSVEAIVDGLNEAGVRYLVVEGLAVVAHGFVRFTAGVDLVLDLSDENLRQAIAVLSSLGYEHRAPVPFEQFADPEARARWIHEKRLTVFSLYSREHPETEIDLFVEAPFDFERAHGAAARFPGLEAPFVGLEDLIEMKKRAARPQDLEDVRRLDLIREKRGKTPEG